MGTTELSSGSLGMDEDQPETELNGYADDEDDEDSVDGIKCEDEYHEDSLPDLVLDAFGSSSSFTQRRPRRSSSQSSQGRSSSASTTSSVDLLTLVGSSPSKSQHNVASALNVASAVDVWHDSDYSAADEIVTEFSCRDGAFKISYVDHRKAYVSKLDALGSGKYRSYLSLMPEDDVSTSAAEATSSSADSDVLGDFRALSFEDQQRQRETWAQELEQTEREIAELKECLAVKTAWCGVLHRQLGTAATTAALRRVGRQVADEARHSLVSAKQAFEQLSNEVRGRVRHGGHELVRAVRRMAAAVDDEHKNDDNANTEVSAALQEV